MAAFTLTSASAHLGPKAGHQIPERGREEATYHGETYR
jgi:hypothetical protein